MPRTLIKTIVGGEFISVSPPSMPSYTAVAGTEYPVGGSSIVVPIGTWEVSYSVCMEILTGLTAGGRNIGAGIRIHNVTDSNYFSEALYYLPAVAANTGLWATVTKSVIFTITSPKTLQLSIANSQADVGTGSRARVIAGGITTGVTAANIFYVKRVA